MTSEEKMQGNDQSTVLFEGAGDFFIANAFPGLSEEHSRFSEVGSVEKEDAPHSIASTKSELSDEGGFDEDEPNYLVHHLFDPSGAPVPPVSLKYLKRMWDDGALPPNSKIAVYQADEEREKWKTMELQDDYELFHRLLNKTKWMIKGQGGDDLNNKGKQKGKGKGKRNQKKQKRRKKNGNKFNKNKKGKGKRRKSKSNSKKGNWITSRELLRKWKNGELEWDAMVKNDGDVPEWTKLIDSQPHYKKVLMANYPQIDHEWFAKGIEETDPYEPLNYKDIHDLWKDYDGLAADVCDLNNPRYGDQWKPFKKFHELMHKLRSGKDVKWDIDDDDHFLQNEPTTKVSLDYIEQKMKERKVFDDSLVRNNVDLQDWIAIQDIVPPLFSRKKVEKEPEFEGQKWYIQDDRVPEDLLIPFTFNDLKAKILNLELTEDSWIRNNEDIPEWTQLSDLDDFMGMVQAVLEEEQFGDLDNGDDDDDEKKEEMMVEEEPVVEPMTFEELEMRINPLKDILRRCTDEDAPLLDALERVIGMDRLSAIEPREEFQYNHSPRYTRLQRNHMWSQPEDDRGKAFVAKEIYELPEEIKLYREAVREQELREKMKEMKENEDGEEEQEEEKKEQDDNKEEEKKEEEMKEEKEKEEEKKEEDEKKEESAMINKV